MNLYIKKLFKFIFACLLVAVILVRLGNDIKYETTDTREISTEIISLADYNLSQDITAENYIVAPMRGDILAGKSANQPVPIASITKLMTTVIALERMQMSTPVSISERALSTEGTSGRFSRGQVFQVSELLYPLLMVSSNDAAEAIAETYGRDDFISAMNTKSAELGMFKTNFADPSGLSPDNTSTPQDLLILARYIDDMHPEIWDITMIRTKSLRGLTWTNVTHFLNLGSYRGGKNGFTDEAKRSAIALFELPERAGEILVVIVLRSDDRTKDVLHIIQSMSLAK